MFKSEQSFILTLALTLSAVFIGTAAQAAAAPSAPTASIGTDGSTTQVDFSPAIYVSLHAQAGATIRYAIDSRFLPIKCGSTDKRNHVLYTGVPVRLYHPGSIWAIACVGEGSAVAASSQVQFNYVQAPLAGRSFSSIDNYGLPYSFSWMGNLPNTPEENLTSTYYPMSHVRVNPMNVVASNDAPQFVTYVSNHCNTSDASANPEDPDSCIGTTNGLIAPYANTAPNNIQPMYAGGAKFHTYRKADACTLAQTMRLLGKSDAEIDRLVASEMSGQDTSKDPVSLIVIKDQVLKTRNAHLDQIKLDHTHYDGKFFVDTCVLPPAPDTNFVKGHWICDESHDGRGPGLVRTFFTKWANLVHGEGKLAYLVFDLMNSRLQLIGTGTQGNNQFLLSTLDKVNLRFTMNDRTFDKYEARFLAYMRLLLGEVADQAHPSVDLRKTYLHIELANLDGGAADPTSLSAAYALRGIAMKYHVPMVHAGGALVETGGGPDRNLNRILKVLSAPAIYVQGVSSGQTVNGTLNLSASLQNPDDPQIPGVTNVDYVQYKVDNTDYGPQLTQAPYAISIDTSQLGPGSHYVRAVVRTKSGSVHLAGGDIIEPPTSGSSLPTLIHVGE